MSDKHPNVGVVDRMTKAIVDQDHDALASIFTDDYVFHFRGAAPVAGDHQGLGGMLETLGWLFEQTDGDIKLDQQFCVAADTWGSEWESAKLGRKGKTLEVENAFKYRFENGRIAEMWFYFGATPQEAEAFFA